MGSSEATAASGAAERAGRPDRPPLELLSDREREVLDRVLEGHTYPSVARALGLSPHTVDTYMRRIRAKTGATHRMQLLRLAMADALETGSGDTGDTGDTRGHAHPDRR
ncbi:response regulator transcription factor [Streptomyces yatensis]|uniref:response regulator transcription factor n=1 Tax=Streptomyces yatensis TaxID=155177 RepID=UPI001FE27603|nr:helix-turn-helix transcriptional regulator [Streptomyces yatensis]